MITPVEEIGFGLNEDEFLKEQERCKNTVALLIDATGCVFVDRPYLEVKQSACSSTCQDCMSVDRRF